MERLGARIDEGLPRHLASVQTGVTAALEPRRRGVPWAANASVKLATASIAWSSSSVRRLRAPRRSMLHCVW
eukprot:9224-Prorocentrum_lima.AAC.1